MGGQQYRETKEIEGSKNTKKISFIKDSETNTTMVVKYYIGIDSYENEKQNEENDKSVIKEYNAMKSQFIDRYPSEDLPILPQILRYDVVKTDFGTNYVMFMEGAKGDSLRTFISDIVFSQNTKFIPNFKNIGHQFGNIYRMLNEGAIGNQQVSRHLVHADPNIGNFIYDRNKGLLFWIDLSGITFEDYDNRYGFKYGSELNILIFVRDMVKAAAEFQGKAEGSSLKHQKKLGINKSVEIIRAHQDFFNGYKEVVDNYRSIPLTLEFIMNSDLDKKKEKGELFFSYNGFLEILNNISTTYQKVTEKSIDLYNGYGIEIPKQF